jgi:predicted permease
MPLFEIATVIIPIILIALIGFIFGKLREINLKTLADYIIYISSPALALSLLSVQRMELKEVSFIALSAALVILGTGAISYILFKVIKLKVPLGLYLPIMYMNSGFIGYPLVLFAFGTRGLSKAIIFDITNAILIFTVGIYMVSQAKNRWQVFKIPFIYAAALGIFLSLTGIKMPQFIHSPIYLIGGTTIPLALFMLGCRLAEIKVVTWKLPLIASCLRLFIGLGLGLLAVFIFKLQGLTANIVILVSSLSSAVTTVALAEEYDANPELVAPTIALSTLLSLVTIVIVLKLFI